ncbi:putative inorganic phosphate cotransporter isoform X2 [Pectinophora gossypiella]|uniref:putative inorganic phosphate cotransporter isoform X2 n=1 Tax=Pectinophora gossypiella TaxID=13191 RepID=UPI00214E5A18|nr:putative inorganic phosphate cotransporter isoform X2 [Pectinophora gossypiella]
MVVGVSEMEVISAPKPESTFGMRHAVIFLLFLATTVSYATRVSMSVAIVAMTTENDYGFQVFNWDLSIQNTVLSSFFWGYILLQIPAGMLAGRFGGKMLIFGSMLCTGIVNLFVPLAASHGGWMAVCACRILMGLFQGLLYPSLHGLLGQWAPATERSRMGTFVYAGAQLGTIIEMMTAGLLSASRWGWPSVYYVAGVTCLVWSVLWFIFGASTPGTSRMISKEERKYIEMNAGSADISEKKKLATPWKDIWTSLPFWSILLAHSGQSLGFWTLLTEMPTYMSKVLGVDIKSNGLLSALPYVAMYLLSFFFSWLADFLVNRNIVALGTSRKIFNTIAFWGPAAALLVLSYLPPGHLYLAVAILTVCVGLNGGHYVGFLISHIDLSPNFASTLMGITNGCGNIFSIMAPLSVSVVVRDEKSASEWRKVFFISIAAYFLTNLFYLLFMSGNVQSWNEPRPTTTIEDGTKKDSNATKNKNEGEEKF